MSFNSGFSIHGSFTSDAHQIEEELRKLKSNGGTNLFPAVTRALIEMKGANHRKKALIVITDAGAGGDLDALRRDIRNSEVLIYTFAIGSLPAVPQRGGFGPPARVVFGSNILDALADESGGQWESFDMNSEDLLSRMINFVQDIAAELRGQYTLGYYPSSVKNSENHIIRVKAASSQHRVRVHRELK